MVSTDPNPAHVTFTFPTGESGRPDNALNPEEPPEWVATVEFHLNRIAQQFHRHHPPEGPQIQFRRPGIRRQVDSTFSRGPGSPDHSLFSGAPLFLADSRGGPDLFL